jgi:hypothetical protein
MRLLFITIIVFSTQYLVAQSVDSLIVSKKEIRNFFNDVWPFIMDESLSKNTIQRLSDKPGNVRLKGLRSSITHYTTPFTGPDIDFIMTQAWQTEKVTWNNSLIDNAAFIKSMT